MKVSELMREGCMNLELHSKEKSEALREMVESSNLDGLVLDKEGLLGALWERERLESTAVGYGIAIPHARTEAVKSMVVVFGRSPAGVDFNSLDGKPVHLVFLIAAPPEDAGMYLKTLARLARLLRQRPFRDQLMNAKSCCDVLTLVGESEDKSCVG